VIRACWASNSTDLPVILRNSNTIYGEKLKNTEEKRAREGVASITTSGGFKRATEKLRKILVIICARMTVKFSWRLCQQYIACPERIYRKIRGVGHDHVTCEQFLLNQHSRMYGLSQSSRNFRQSRPWLKFFSWQSEGGTLEDQKSVVEPWWKHLTLIFHSRLLPFDSIQGTSGYPIAAQIQQGMSSRQWIASSQARHQTVVA
jgi:hypothetical protein